jgi:hypothetical protein
MRRRSWIFAAAVALPCGPVAAAPIDAEHCASLKAEQSQLEQAGVRDDMQKGADWGKAHLSPAKLQDVKHLIEVDEQVLFRCGSKSLVTLPAEEPEPAPATDAQPAAEAKAEPKAKAPAASAKKAHSAAIPKATAPAKPAKSSREAGAGAKAAPSKPKVDDAYRPPPAPPGADPFARQLEAPAKK